MWRIWPNGLEAISCPAKVTAVTPPIATGPRRCSGPRLADLPPFEVISYILCWLLTLKWHEMRWERSPCWRTRTHCLPCPSAVLRAPGLAQVPNGDLPVVQLNWQRCRIMYQLIFADQQLYKWKEIIRTNSALGLKPSTSSADFNRSECENTTFLLLFLFKDV